jgi:hypothetical protein
MLSVISETTKTLTNAVISPVVTFIGDSLKNIRIEDLTKIFTQDPRTNQQIQQKNIQLMQHINLSTYIYCDTNILPMNDLISPEMIDMNLLISENNKKEDNVTNRNHINKLQISERRLNEEYLLSIHSTNMRSRRRLHVRGSDNVVTLNRKTIDMIESKLCSDKRAISVLNDINNKNKLALDSISFSGGGYNCMYHMGVVKYIFENPTLFKDTKYLAASGGVSVAALVLCFENDPDKFKVLREIIEFVIDIRFKNLKLNKQVDEYSNKVFQYISNEKFNMYILNSDRCHISVTNVTYIIPQNEIKTKFTSYSQFMDTLKASACIPILLDNKIRTIDGNSYLDGGLSNNLPVIDENTLKISCLNYPFLNAHLYPKYVCDIAYSFTPPDENYIMNMHDQGYNDIEQYMRDRFIRLQKVNSDNDLNDCINKLIDDPTFCN